MSDGPEGYPLDQWVHLNETRLPFFFSGAMVRFKTTHTAGDGWKYAVATRIDNAKDISFLGLDGGTWGYGRCTLPEEARFEGRPYTFSTAWLRENFDHIAIPEDDDIWIVRSAAAFMRRCEELSSPNL